MLEAEKIELFHYLISFELCFYIISHSSSKHPLSLSEFTDKEIDILPSKANLATVNPNLVAKCVPRVMLGWWFTVDQGTLIRLSQTENTWGAGVRHAELHIILKSIQDLRAHLIWGHSNLDKLFQGLKHHKIYTVPVSGIRNQNMEDIKHLSVPDDWAMEKGVSLLISDKYAET